MKSRPAAQTFQNTLPNTKWFAAQFAARTLRHHQHVPGAGETGGKAGQGRERKRPKPMALFRGPFRAFRVLDRIAGTGTFQGRDRDRFRDRE